MGCPGTRRYRPIAFWPFKREYRKETFLSLQQDHISVRKQVSLGETLGVLACLLAAVMFMSMGRLLASNKVTQADAQASAISVPL